MKKKNPLIDVQVSLSLTEHGLLVKRGHFLYLIIIGANKYTLLAKSVRAMDKEERDREGCR